MTVLLQLAGALAGIDGPAIDAATTEKLRMHVLDTLGALLAGSRTVEGRALIAFAARSGDDSGVLVARNCALARLSEMDDIHLGARVTAGSIIIPGVITLAGLLGAPQDDVMAAILSGYEAMIRLGRAVEGPSVATGGIWPTYFAAGFGIAAAAARLRRLDPERTAHALSLALIRATPSVGYHNAPTTTRWLAIGEAARSGWLAVHATESGFTSDLSVLDGAFLKLSFNVAQDTTAFTSPIAVPAFMGVSLKPWCGARQTVAATQALKEVLAQGVRAEDVRAIEAYVLPPHRKMVDHGVTPGDRASFITSLPWQMAVAALAPHLAFDAQQCPAEPDPALLAFMQRISIHPEERFLTAYPEAWHARVVLTTEQGRHERLVTHVPGDPARPFSQDDVAAKFKRVTATSLGEEKADGVVRAILNSGRWMETALAILRNPEKPVVSI